MFDVQLQHQFSVDPEKKTIDEWPGIPLESVIFFMNTTANARSGRGTGHHSNTSASSTKTTRRRLSTGTTRAPFL
jgi:hypothetical protein